MKNPLKNIAKKFGGLAAKIALVSTLAFSTLQSKAEIYQTQDYANNWNVNTTFALDPDWISSTDKPVSKIYLDVTNLPQGISNLNFYAAGLMNTNIQLYEWIEEETRPIKSLVVRSPEWQVESLENLGKWPAGYYDTQTNHIVFEKDIYKVKLATTDGLTKTDAQLEIDLITDENNTTNNNQLFLVGYGNPAYSNYYNRVYTHRASTNDWDNDGVNNLNELYSGTDPTNKNSYMQITNIAKTAEGTKVYWTGSLTNVWNETIKYALEKKTNLNESTWNSAETNLNALSSTDTNANISEKDFYRVNLETKPNN